MPVGHFCMGLNNIFLLMVDNSNLCVETSDGEFLNLEANKNVTVDCLVKAVICICYVGCYHEFCSFFFFLVSLLDLFKRKPR